MEIRRHEKAICEFKICQQHRDNLLPKIIRHEVGHYIMSQLQGFSAENIVICLLDEGGQYDCSVQQNTDHRLPDLSSVDAYIEGRILTVFAGVMAETLENGKCNDEVARNSWNGEGCSKDKSNINELICLLKNIRFAESSDEDFSGAAEIMFNDLWNKARIMVKSSHATIALLTKHIFEKVDLGGNQHIFDSTDIQKYVTLH